MQTAVRVSVATVAAAAIGVACALVPSPAPATVAQAAGYSAAPRCDGPRGTATGAPVRVALVGNSVAAELRSCLGTILSQRGHSLENLNNPGAAFCDLERIVRERTAQGVPLPDLAVLYGVRLKVTACTRGDDSPERWAQQANRLVDFYLAHGADVVMIPPPLRIGGRGEDPSAPLFRAIARKHPTRVWVHDVGTYLRGPDGLWASSAPCVSSNEVGCKNGRLGVRDPRDRMHMCAAPARDYPGYKCPPWWGGGQRRASSAVANAIFRHIG